MFICIYGKHQANVARFKFDLQVSQNVQRVACWFSSRGGLRKTMYVAKDIWNAKKLIYMSFLFKIRVFKETSESPIKALGRY